MATPNPLEPVKVPVPHCGFTPAMVMLMQTRCQTMSGTRLAKMKDLTPAR